jgi:type IV pilus assembly protein PilM
MAEERGFWGIEIGQAGLKALRIQSVEGAGKAVATNFDYIAHAKLLSQPDAVPEELIATALDTFLSRNDVRGDAVAISVPAQQTLARFIQLPPVEQSKVGQIVQYEAKQQIPFALEEAIWDYQTLGGGSEESGYLLEAEVGIFAIKRDQLQQHLRPFLDRKVEVELIQGSSLALFNYLAYDRLKVRAGEPFTAGDDYIVLAEMGTDNTILVVTNGAKIWIRVVPIGGNHFTRALVKDMKLTFAKAEHLKCNATKSPDPKAVFQAMRPVFNDYVAEIQRSIGYFSSVNRSAKITKVLGAGNGFKLAGLQKFMQQNLQYPVERVERFESLVGEKVLSDAVFQENILGFVVPYGLAAQAMGQGPIHTTLLPPEIATARKIRRKKPWAVLTAAALMAMLAISAIGYGNVMRSVDTPRWGDAEAEVKKVNDLKSSQDSAYAAVETKVKDIDASSDKLIGDVSTRSLWLELLRAVNECLPRDTDPDVIASDDITKKDRIRILSMTTQKVPDLATWYAALSPQVKKQLPKDDADLPPTGKGYVVTLIGEHFHTGADESDSRIDFVVNTLLKSLRSWTAQQEGTTEKVPVGQMGISHAVYTSYEYVNVPDPRNFTDLKDEEESPFGSNGPNPYGPAGAEGYGTYGATNPALGGIPGVQPTENGGPAKPKYKEIVKTSFTIEFAWRPVKPEDRKDARPPATEEEKAAAKAAVEAAGQAPAAGEGGSPAGAH